MAEGSIQQGALDDLAQWLRASLDRTYCRVMVVDERVEYVDVAAAAAATRGTPLEWSPYAARRTMLAELPGPFLDRDPILLEGYAIPRTAPFLPAIGKDPLTELLIVPLVVDGRVVGLLDLGECRARTQPGGRLEHGQPRRPSRPGLDGKDSLLDLARQMAPLAAGVIESERKRQLLERLVGTLRDLQSETGALWRSISHLGAELLSAACGAIYVCHANTEEFVLLASNNRGNLAEFLVPRCRRGEGFVGSLGPTAARCWPDDGGGQSPFIDGAALRAAVAVAIPGADIETVLVVADDARRRVFTDAEIDVLKRFVLHASLAHRRAHLSPENRQLAQFKVLHQITDYTRNLQDLDQVLHALLTGVTAGYGLRFNRAALFLYNEARTTLDGKMAIGNVTWEDALADWQHDRQAGPYDFAEYVEIVGGSPLPVTRLHELVTGLSLPLDEGGVLRDALDAPRLLLSNHAAGRLPDALRKVFAPDAKAPILLVRLMTTHPLGLIIADNRFNGAPVSLEAIEALTTFAGAAAIAIERFQLRDESELVDRAARALVEPPDTHDLVAVMRRIVGEAVTLCNASIGVLWPYYEDGQQFAPQLIAVNLGAGSERDMLACRPRTSGMARRVLEKHYVAVPSVAVEPVLGSERRRLLEAAGIQSFQGIVLQVGNERLGVLYVDYPAPRRFEDVDRRRLTRFAVHAALALKSARLARRVHDAQRTERALARIAPLTYLDKTIDQIANLAKELLECEVVVLHVYDASTDMFISHHHVGDLVDPEAAARDVQEDSSLVRTVMEQSGPLAVEELEQDRLFGPARFARDERIQSCLALPLKVSNPDLAVGALFANFRDRRRFTADLRMRARSFASQAGIAIGNALKLRENEALAAVPRALLTTENLQDTLDCVARMTAAAFGLRGTSPVMSQVVLKEGLDLVIRAVAEGDERLIGTSVPPGIGSQAGFAADRTEPVVALYDDPQLPFNVSDEVGRGFKSGMSARMVVGKEVTGVELIGVLEVRSRYVREFGESHAVLLLSVAAQAAMAIKADRRNADLERQRGHLQALRRAEECAERVRVRRGGMTREAVLNELLQIVVECYREHSVAPRPVLMLTDLPLAQSAFKWTWGWTKVDHVQKPHFDQQFDARVEQLLALAANWPFESESETTLSLVMHARKPVDIVVGVIESHVKTKDVLGLELETLKARGRNAYVGDWQSNARKLGTQLYRTLLKQPEITRAIDSAIARQQRINIAGNLDLLDVPLELIRDESGRDYHVLHYPFSRSVLDVRAPRGYAAPLSPRLLNDLHRQGMKLRVLLIAANTGNIPSVDKEIDEIYEILENNPNGLGTDIKVVRSSEATRDAVSRQLETGSYHIVHYAGHGEFVSERTANHGLHGLVLTRNRDVILPDGPPQGQPDATVREYLTATQLSVLWSKNPPSLFYMSACWGAAIGRTSALLNNDLLGLIDAAISAGVPSVIGFRWPVTDQGAFALSKVFYQELMRSGRPDQALRTARVDVYSSPQPDAAWLSPVLVMQPP